MIAIVDFLAGGLIAACAFVAGVRAGRRQLPQAEDLQRLHDEIRQLYEAVREGNEAA